MSQPERSKNLYNLANYYCRQHFFNCSKSLDLTKLYHATKNSDAYLGLPTKVSKQIIKCLTASRRGYFQAIKEWSKHPQRFLGQPKIPKSNYTIRSKISYTIWGLLKKSFSGIGNPHLTSPRMRSRDVACNVPTEERGIGRGGSRIYLYLDFSAQGTPKILTV